MGTRGSFLWGKADRSPPFSAVKEWVELYLHSPNAPSWRGAQLKKAQGQLYLHLPCPSTWILPHFLAVHMLQLSYILVKIHEQTLSSFALIQEPSTLIDSTSDPVILFVLFLFSHNTEGSWSVTFGVTLRRASTHCQLQGTFTFKHKSTDEVFSDFVTSDVDRSIVGSNPTQCMDMSVVTTFNVFPVMNVTQYFITLVCFSHKILLGWLNREAWDGQGM
jgi:hypothetical protein